MSGLLSKIKNDVKKSGQNKGKFIYFREGTKLRIRFLQDMDDGKEIEFHDSFEKSINVPCQETFGKNCEYCEDESLRTRSQYIWSVWDYESKEVKLFMFPVNNCSPIPALIAMYDNYGTLTDRDYVISVSGKQQNKTFSVVPMDKNKFRNEKAKPYSEKALLSMLNKAFPNDSNDDEDEEEAEEKRPVKNSKSKVNSKSKSEDDDWEDEEDSEEMSYEDMSPKELYALCKERKIDVESRKPAKYYINQLEEYDEAQDDWEEEAEAEDDDWED